MTLPVDMTVHRPIMMLVDEPSRPDCEAEERIGRRSPRSCTSAIITVRPPSWMFAVPVIAARRETLLPESWGGVRRRGLCWEKGGYRSTVWGQVHGLAREGDGGKMESE